MGISFAVFWVECCQTGVYKGRSEVKPLDLIYITGHMVGMELQVESWENAENTRKQPKNRLK
jgi:hypothetical protein